VEGLSTGEEPGPSTSTKRKEVSVLDFGTDCITFHAVTCDFISRQISVVMQTLLNPYTNDSFSCCKTYKRAISRMYFLSFIAWGM
jgi:hypothetical protein